MKVILNQVLAEPLKGVLWVVVMVVVVWCMFITALFKYPHIEYSLTATNRRMDKQIVI